MIYRLWHFSQLSGFGWIQTYDTGLFCGRNQRHVNEIGPFWAISFIWMSINGNGKWICIYSSFLVLMTTQSTLQYSFTFTQFHTHIHTVRLLAAFCCSMRHNSGFCILLKDTSACRFFWGEDWGLNCWTSGWRRTTLPPQPQPPNWMQRRCVIVTFLYSSAFLSLEVPFFSVTQLITTSALLFGNYFLLSHLIVMRHYTLLQHLTVHTKVEIVTIDIW